MKAEKWPWTFIFVCLNQILLKNNLLLTLIKLKYILNIIKGGIIYVYRDNP